MSEQQQRIKKKKKKKKKESNTTTSEKPFNFLKEAGRGCYVCLNAPNRTSDFIIGFEKYYADDYDSDCEIPSVALDPEAKTLTLTNTNEYPLSATLSVRDIRCLGKDGKKLEPGFTVSKEGTRSICTTFILRIPPYTFLHVCRFDLEDEEFDDKDDLLAYVMERLDSDVQRCEGHAKPQDFHPLSVTFPFLSSSKNDNDDARDDGHWYLCTQGIGGSFTHTFYGNFHAVDFRCTVGTPIIAGADGIVTDIRNDVTDKSSGISASNLYSWNSIQIKVTEKVGNRDDDDVEEQGNKSKGEDEMNFDLNERNREVASTSERFAESLSITDDELFIEYVHVKADSFTVKVGDSVKRGDIICESGESGFCPEPHLHFSAFRKSDAKAPTVGVKFSFEDRTIPPLVPEAGMYYSALRGARNACI